jgi:hypothetical protein
MKLIVAQQFFQYHIGHKIALIEYNNATIFVCITCNEKLLSTDIFSTLGCPEILECKIKNYKNCIGPGLIYGKIVCGATNKPINEYIKDKE